MRVAVIAALVVLVGGLAMAYPVWVVTDHAGEHEEHVPGPDGLDGTVVVEPVRDVLWHGIDEGLPGGVGSVDFVVPDGYLEVLVSAFNATGDGLVRLVLDGPGGEHVLVDGVWQDTSPWRAPAAAGDWSLDWEVRGRLSVDIRVRAQ